MKKTLLFIALVVGASNLTYAQQANKATANNAQAQQAASMTPEQRIDRKVQRLTTELNLTTQQQASVRQILTQGNNTLAPMRETKDKQKISQAKKTVEQQIEAVLTPEQRTKLHQKMQDRMAKTKEGNANVNTKAN
jgi:Spy/CpxP family protein refolding chaperone